MLNSQQPANNNDWSGQDLSDRDLSNRNLSHHKLVGTNLNGSDLSHCHLNGANLENACLYGVSLKYATLYGTRLQNAKLTGADLSNADLTGTELAGADLRRCNFKNAKFSNTDFSNANVEGAYFGESKGLTEDAKRELQRRGAIFKASVSRFPNIKWLMRFVIVPLAVASIGGVMTVVKQQPENCPKDESVSVNKSTQKTLPPETTPTNKAKIPNSKSK